MKEPLLMSACLMGYNCKYNGGNNALPEDQIKALQEKYRLVLICPESQGGLPTPRTPAERIGDRVISKTGVDVTAQYQKGSDIALAAARENGCTRALLKERSPSCGVGIIYDGTFTGTRIPGYGVAAQLLKDNGLQLFTESQVEELLREK